MNRYVETEHVGARCDAKDRVEIVESVHGAFHGMRVLIVRDVNRLRITFGQPR